MTDEMLGGVPDTNTLMQAHNSFDFAQTHSTPPDPAQLFAAAQQQQQLQQQQLQQQLQLRNALPTLNAGGAKVDSSNSSANGNTAGAAVAHSFFATPLGHAQHQKSPAVQWIVALQAAGVPDDTAIALAARTASCALRSRFEGTNSFFFFFFFFFFSGLCSRQMSPLHVLNSLTADEVAELGLVGQPFLLVCDKTFFFFFFFLFFSRFSAV
jgi:hypothetical protein